MYSLLECGTVLQHCPSPVPVHM